MVILLVVDATMFASLVFAHVHVSMRADVCPPPGAGLPGSRGAWPRLAAVGGLGAGDRGAAARLGRCRALVGARAAHRRRARSHWRVAAAATSCRCRATRRCRQRADAWSATVAALLAYQALHAVVLVAMAAYLAARWGAGLVLPSRRATLDNVTLFWGYAALQGCVVAGVVQWLPRWL